MKRTLKRSLALAAMSAAMVWAGGGLSLEVGNPEANPEARSMNASLVARVIACGEPAKSTVTANLLQRDGGDIQRTALKVVALKSPGEFAVIGEVPAGSVIDLAVSNPVYRNYQPHVLVRRNAHGVQRSSLRRFFGSTPPADADIRAALDAVD